MDLAGLEACIAMTGDLAELEASLRREIACPEEARLISAAIELAADQKHDALDTSGFPVEQQQFVANLQLMGNLVDWTHGLIRNAHTRRHLVSPADDDILVRLNLPQSWPLVCVVNYAMLSRVKPSHKCAVVVTMRDDGVTILDWVAHYRAIGFDGIFVYTNDNSDESLALLVALAEHGIVTLIENRTSGTVNPQRKAFSHSLHLLPELRDYEWVFYADSDEFLIPAEKFDFNIQNVLSELQSKYLGRPLPSAICYHWKWFFSSFEYAWHPQPLAERFVHAVGAALFKSVVKLSDVVSMHPLHFPETMSGAYFVDSDLNVIAQSTKAVPGALWQYKEPCYDGGQINHYWCRSFQEFALKKRRGDALVGPEVLDFKRDYDLFFSANGPADPSTLQRLSRALLRRHTTQLRDLRSRPGITEIEQKVRAGFKQLLESLGGDEQLRSIYDEAARRHAHKLRTSDHTGPWYTEVLADLHQALKPRRYFEIGVSQGHSLALAHCESLAIDPELALNFTELKDLPVCHLYRQTSDQFFERHSPPQILGASIDLAFLDGLHHFESLLRDFMNTERYCDQDSIIVLHDCIPTDIYVARRDFFDQSKESLSDHHDWWAGDVWKTLLILRKYRPDLRIVCLDAQPTGLVIITNLNRDSNALFESYDAALGEFEAVSLAEYGVAKLHADIKLMPTASIWDSGTGPKRLISGFRSNPGG